VCWWWWCCNASYVDAGIELRTVQLILTGVFKQFSFFNFAKHSGLMGKSFTSFSEFQIFGAAWLNALDENFVHAARDSQKVERIRVQWLD